MLGVIGVGKNEFPSYYNLHALSYIPLFCLTNCVFLHTCLFPSYPHFLLFPLIIPSLDMAEFPPFSFTLSPSSVLKSAHYIVVININITLQHHPCSGISTFVSIPYKFLYDLTLLNPSSVLAIASPSTLGTPCSSDLIQIC